MVELADAIGLTGRRAVASQVLTFAAWKVSAEFSGESNAKMSPL